MQQNSGSQWHRIYNMSNAKLFPSSHDASAAVCNGLARPAGEAKEWDINILGQA